MRITVLGAGSWGTALAILLGRNGHEVLLHGRNREEMIALQSVRENMRYLPGFAIPSSVTVAIDADEVAESDMWVVAVPSGAVRQVLHVVQGEKPLLAMASKGLEPGSGKLMIEVVAEELPEARCGAFSGPNLAVEIARGIPTAAVSAFEDEKAAEQVALAFNCRAFRVYLATDVVGVEIAGALKNVLAIGAGISDGLGFGDNTKGAFLARGLGEMIRLGTAMGGQASTFMGIAGVGDLFATAASCLSRNYRVGKAIGQGSTVAEACDEVGQVAEGIPTSEAVMMLARRHQVHMPVFEAIDNVVKGRVRPLEGVSLLMERMPKFENE